MKQFILDREPDSDNIVRLEGNDYHYLVRVRRLAAGEAFNAFLPDGSETSIKILSISKNILTGECQITPPCFTSSSPHRNIILFQSLPKSDKMDLIVRQAAESGIKEIVPFVSEFSVVPAGKTGAGISEQKFLRWERIIKEARQQSGSKTATGICKPLTINQLLDYWVGLIEKDKTIGLLFHHRGLENEGLHSYLYNVTSGNVVIAIGPEGGFSDTEVTLFLQNGFKPVMIGDTILRAETAALYCAAAVRILLLESNQWELKQK